MIHNMNFRFRRIIEKSLAITVAVMMAVTCFAVVNTDYAYAKKKKVISVTLTNVGSTLVMKKGTSKKLKYSIQATKKKYKKVKWKSSNKKVVTVTKKGKIKAKKNGTAYITVYSKTKKKVKDRVKVKVVTYVSSVSLGSSTIYVRKGKDKTISATVKPSSASNKKLTWASSNTNIATVSQSGKVFGKQTGIVTIQATSKDGTKKTGRVTVKVIELHRSDAVFIAHRGYSAYYPENTIPAFAAAAEANFHGAEMDVWESYTYQKEIPNPDYVSPDEQEPPDESGEDPPEENGEDPPEENPETILVDAFDLNIMHNSTTGDMCRQDVSIRSVNDLNRTEYPITKGNGIGNYSDPLYIPTLDQVLETLYETNLQTGHETLPVIELKQTSYSDAAMERILDLVGQYGGKATIISFNESALCQAKAEINAREAEGMLAEGDVQIQYLVRSNSQSNVNTCVADGFDGISIKYTEVTKSIVNYAHSKGLVVAAWTMPSMAEAARMIDLGVDRVTSDYKLFLGD